MKIIPFEKLAFEIRQSMKPDQKLILAHGVYDRLHGGHVLQFMGIKERFPDAILLVTITCDSDVRANKGAGRPYCNEDVRLKMLSGQTAVDFCSVVHFPDAIPVIEEVKPDWYVKGTEYQDKINDALRAEIEAVQKHGGQMLFVGSETPEMSTSLNVAAGESDVAYDFMRDFVRLSDKNTIMGLLDRMSEKRVLIAGDGIFDVTTFVDMGDKAPKTTILAMQHQAWRQGCIKTLGGAFFMAKTAAQFVKRVTVSTGVGTLEFIDGFRFPSQRVIDGLPRNVERSIWWLGDRCPNIKWRWKESIFLENPQRQTLSQVCFLSGDDYPDEAHEKLLEDLTNQLKRHDVTILADFGHGYCSREVYQTVGFSDGFTASMAQANESQFGFNTFWKVPKTDFLCIDDVELRLGFGAADADVEGLSKILVETGRFQNIAVTQGKEGCLMVTPNLSVRVPAVHANVVDRIGAGDTFMILATLALSCGASPSEAGLIGNIGGALACGVQSNATAINSEQIREYVGRLFR